MDPLLPCEFPHKTQDNVLINTEVMTLMFYLGTTDRLVTDIQYTDW